MFMLPWHTWMRAAVEKDAWPVPASRWRPDAIVVTGDLTDAKAPGGRGVQYESEWQVGGAGTYLAHQQAGPLVWTGSPACTVQDRTPAERDSRPCSCSKEHQTQHRTLGPVLAGVIVLGPTELYERIYQPHTSI
jgi:hypothetical protein